MENYRTLEIVQRSPKSSVSTSISTVLLSETLSPSTSSQSFQSHRFPRPNPNVSVIILSGNGAHFCSGIDLKVLDSISERSQSSDRGRTGERLRRHIKFLQDAITAIEHCRKPVIAGIHGACIGAGIDVVTACDIRFCTEDAFFSVKEVDLAITADVGTLQRLPSIVGYGNAVELALTGRRFSGSEAKSLGLVSTVFASKEAMDEGIRLVAEGTPIDAGGVGIAAKSPLAVTGTKAVLLRGRDLTVDQGLDYVATWNSGMLLSGDLAEAVSAQIQKRKPVFAKL
ncbi:Delta(3,5)-Delta(2,4)-dienoyl-CoA isomerase, peroxisomal [Vitis vinifera]|uniref:Delta(3,5)-Delta(2,4)-dienoyl-CoA isomerase, peroxisomal n=1 Tax=Vitis vinifera TaxID=29760 RepID=A0A438D963_VITVI|nr:Delta(3,5)-Delta(2,4)-dienoyl-CoA isomerase, peroxisomal [Vitis vinifera]